MRYNHRNHAGNAGDVWKHFILAEVAEYLLAKEKNLVYIESHWVIQNTLLKSLANAEWH